jgi:hypothetical protein
LGRGLRCITGLSTDSQAGPCCVRFSGDICSGHQQQQQQVLRWQVVRHYGAHYEEGQSAPATRDTANPPPPRPASVTASLRPTNCYAVLQ